MRQGVKLLFLIVLLCLSLSCEPNANSPPSRNPAKSDQFKSSPYLNLAQILPDGWDLIATYRLNANGKDELEWVVLYHFDLLDGRGQGGTPIGVIIYQLDDESPPNVVAHELRARDGDLLCECTCEVETENVLSALDGDEVVVSDLCNEEVTRLTIFNWDAAKKAYVSLGHFLADDIEVSRDKVLLKEHLPGRAQLIRIRTYYPYDNKTYYRQGELCTLLECKKEELDFCHGEPEDPLCSRYPEKVVLAFYEHYKDDETAPTYFTEKVRDHLGQCDAGECGCIAPRHEIAHVRVTYLQPEEPTQVDANRAVVGVRVVCEHRDGVEEGERYIRWHLVREDDRWQLERPE